MTSSSRQSIACILALFSVALVSLAVHAQTAPAKEPAITVSGKATVKGKGVQGINIILRQSDFNYNRRDGNTFKAVTDDEGNYRIANVPRGEYRIFALAPAFVPETEADRERLLIVGKSETVEHVDFTLVRGGVITGKVVDAEGRPAVEEAVYVLSAQDNKFVYPQYNSNTDDRGVYRLYGLRAGSYRVAAGRTDESFMHGAARAYKQTFYPSTNDPAEATIVEVSEGSETRDIDIVFSRTLTSYTVKGRVVDGDTGQPVPSAGFGITRYEQGNSASRGWGAVTNARGEFKIENITPGTYSISIAPPPDADWRVDETRFEVVDHDVADLVFKTIRSGSISGVVVLEGVDEKAAREQLKRMTLTAYIDGQLAPARSSSVRLNADGSFQVRGLAGGNANFYLHSESGVRLDRVERDGVIQPRGMAIKEREHVKGVRLIAQLGNATLRGKIDVANGTLPADARFYVWAKRIGDEPGGMYSGMNVRPQVDERGQFVIAGLTPGNYELYAGVFFTGAKVGYKAQKEVVVTAGTTSDVSITVDLNSTPIKQP
jgi:protocatechuate 3,4-dioxygenase beta subunit